MRERDRGAARLSADMRPRVGPLALAVALLLALSSCKGERVSLGDDTDLSLAARDASTLTDASPGSAPDAAADASHHPPEPFPRDAGSTPRTCGRCAMDEVCLPPDDPACGALPGQGECVPIFMLCPGPRSLVCACDGQSYVNRCEAAAFGVPVRHEGACSGGSSRTCSSFGGAPCDEGEYCRYPLGSLCGSVDPNARCERRPLDCAPFESFPVCGCDGFGYPDACSAARAGVSVSHLGSCEGGGRDGPPRDDRCGGFSGAECRPGEYCDYAGSDDCGVAGSTGECRPRPQSCPAESEPVCACDGRTYDGECAAARQGVSIDFPGDCAGG